MPTADIHPEPFPETLTVGSAEDNVQGDHGP
jgi:hypothetical protein